MIVFLALAASIQQPSVTMFRNQWAEAGWRQCIVMVGKEIEEEMPADSIEALGDEGRLDLAKEICRSMADDYRRTLPDRIKIFAREKGLNISGSDALSDLLVDDVYREVEESLSLKWDPSR